MSNWTQFEYLSQVSQSVSMQIDGITWQ